jgi:hypothetical protein
VKQGKIHFFGGKAYLVGRTKMAFTFLHGDVSYPNTFGAAIPTVLFHQMKRW